MKKDIKINKIQHDILMSLDNHGGEMTYVIRNILSMPHYGFGYDWNTLKTSKVLYSLKKLESIGLVTRVTGGSNPYKVQIKWTLIPMRDRRLMNDEKEYYPGQFDEWADGAFVDGDIYQLPTLQETKAAISANYAIMTMINHENWDI